MLFSLVFGVDNNVIEIYNNKNVKFFYQDLIDIVLKCGWYVGQVKRYYLVLEVAIPGPKGCLLFMAFSDPHLMIGIN